MTDRAALRRALDAAEARLRAGRLQRLMRQPVKVALPRLLRAMGGARAVSARTFWGGRFEGVIPEHVSLAIWRFGFLDAGVCRTLLDRLPEGGTFLDVGAHFGFFTLLGSALAGPSGRVVAVEAMPATLARLEANVARNAAHRNVTVVPCAAHSSEARLAFADFGLVDSSLNSAHAARGATAGTGQRVEVAARPVDAILAGLGIGRVDLAKIDAESAEIDVLEGMRGLIARCRPPIVVEAASMTPDQTAHSLRVDAWLGAEGYRARRWQGGRMVAAGPIEAVGYDNLVYLPD